MRSDLRHVTACTIVCIILCISCPLGCCAHGRSNTQPVGDAKASLIPKFNTNREASEFVCRTHPPSLAFWSSLAHSLSAGSTLLTANSSSGWTNATQLWVRNPDGPRKPFAVVYCANTADVQTVLRACAAAHLCVSVRSSGHNFLAWSELSNRVVVDVSRINSTRLVQPGLVAAGPGTNLEMINSFTEEQNLASTIGDCPGVRLGGYLQGGGEGFLQHLSGLGLDSVVGLDVVLPNATLLTNVSAQFHPDLYWALRGGGGPAANFGVVVQYYLHMIVPPPVLIWSLTFSAGEDSVTASVRATSPMWATSDTTISCSWQMDGTVILSGWWTGSKSALQNYMDGLAHGLSVTQRSAKASTVWAGNRENFDSFGILSKGAVAVAPMSSLYAPHGLNRSALAAIQQFLATGLKTLPTLPKNTLFFAELWIYNGAVAAVPSSATAFPHRGVLGNIECGFFFPPGTSADVVDMAHTWVLKLVTSILLPACKDSGTGVVPVYANQGSVLLPSPLLSYYAGNLPRLQQVKARYDPQHYFRSPQSL